MRFRFPAIIIGVILILAVGLVTASNAQQSYLHGDLEPGSYKVGFSVYHEYDYSRTYKPEFDDNGVILTSHSPRPMQIGVWYPVEKTAAGNPMKFRDFYYLDATVEDPTIEVTDLVKLNMDQAFQYQQIFTGPANPDKIHQFLDLETMAIKDAPVAAGQFPLVIYSPREYRGIYYNTQLIEHLVSHGFVVAATPNKDDVNSVTQAPRTTEVLQTNIADLAFVKGFASKLPHVDAQRVGVAGWAWGGASAVALAEKDPNVAAIVSLDGSMRFPGQLAFLDAVPGYQTATLTKPVVHLEMSNPANPQPPNYTFFDQVKYADVYHAKFRDAQWFSASSGFYLIHAKGTANPAQFDFTTLDRVFVSIVDYATKFLAAYLKGDMSAHEWLNRSTSGKGFAEGEVVERIQSGITPPPDEATFTNLFVSRGSATARKVWDRVAAQDPDYKIASANSLNNLGYTLIGQGEIEEAVVALELQTEAYPEIANAWDSLGEGYMANGDDEKAIVAFKQSLKMNPPQNTKANSISLLGQLGVDWVEPEPYPLTEAKAAGLVGRYEIAANGQTVITNVSWEDDQLVAQSAGQPQIQLVPRSENTFWAFAGGNAVGVTFEFVEFDHGKAVMAKVTTPQAQTNVARRVDEPRGTE